MKNRILNSDGSYATYIKPVIAGKPEPKAPIEANVLTEVDEPATIVDKDYTIMNFKQLKAEATEKGIEFKGNVSQKKLLALLVDSDEKKNGTDVEPLAEVGENDTDEL